MGDLGVELHAVDRLLAMAERGIGRVGARRERLEVAAERRHPVAVTHPHARRTAAAKGEERVEMQDADIRRLLLYLPIFLREFQRRGGIV